MTYRKPTPAGGLAAVSGFGRRIRRLRWEAPQRCQQRGAVMKYMIMLYGSQQDYDVLAGRPTDKPAMSADDIAAMHGYMESFHKRLTESGELVDAQGLTAPVHARRVQL